MIRCGCFEGEPYDCGGCTESLSESTQSSQPETGLVAQTPSNLTVESGLRAPAEENRYTGDFVDWNKPWPRYKRMETTEAGASYWAGVRETVGIEFYRKVGSFSNDSASGNNGYCDYYLLLSLLLFTLFWSL